jgi:hypothetical protein
MGRVNPVAVVLAGHLIGDWIVQTDWQAANKTSSWKAMWQHMLGYHAVLGSLAALALPAPRMLALTAVSLATHAVIDRRWPVVWLCDVTGSHDFGGTLFGRMAVDQALHLSILLLAVAALT